MFCFWELSFLICVFLSGEKGGEGVYVKHLKLPTPIFLRSSYSVGKSEV